MSGEDDDAQRPLMASTEHRWLCGHGQSAVSGRNVVLPVLLALCVTAVCGDDVMLTIVNIRASGEQISRKSCPIKCTGTLLTDIIVLTAASCTGPDEPSYMPDKENGSTIDFTTTTTTRDQNEYPTTMFSPLTTKKTNTTLKIGDIKVYASVPTDSNYRYATDKYLHPEWNSSTGVADLALLKINASFPEYTRITKPLLFDNDMLKLPPILKFRGFGKINDAGHSIFDYDNSLPTKESNVLRMIRANFSVDSCPVSNKGVLTNDTNKWSFLCTDSPDVRTTIKNTLCSNDKGGPLYSIQEPKLGQDPQVRLYGVFSRTYHVIYPFCATQECTLLSKAPYPCNINPEAIYYQHTAMLGRYAVWVEITVEKAMRTVTAAPTRDCPSQRTTVTTQVTTLDPIYDIDIYENQLMGPNHRVCPKGSSSAASFAVVRAATVLSAAGVARFVGEAPVRII